MPPPQAGDGGYMACCATWKNKRKGGYGETPPEHVVRAEEKAGFKPDAGSPPFVSAVFIFMLLACNTTKENYVSVIFHPVKIILPNNPIRSISPLKLLEAYTYGDCHGVRSASGSMLVNLPVVA